MRLCKNTNIKIGSKLQKARISNGYTQEQVSELVGCSSRYIGQLETNTTLGSISIIINLCNLYNISLNELFSDFLNLENDLPSTNSFCGYINLSEEYKSIVDNTIVYLNQLQNEKKEGIK